jgi:uncharacterized protein
MDQKKDYRRAIADYIEVEAQPPDKFAHQPRLYRLAAALGQGHSYDDDIVYAAAWLHDLGVFAGHRPTDPGQLAGWDNVAYACRIVPELLPGFGFPTEKIDAVQEAIRTHLPTRQPITIEGTLVRDADILEQLGAIGILRTVSKVGRDTRFPTHREAVLAVQKQARDLAGLLKLPQARPLADQRVALMTAFLQAALADGGVDYL